MQNVNAGFSWNQTGTIFKKKLKKSPQKVNDQIEIWASQPATLI